MLLRKVLLITLGAFFVPNFSLKGSGNFFKRAYNLSSNDLVLVLNGSYQQEIEEAFIRGKINFNEDQPPTYRRRRSIYPVMNSAIKFDRRSSIVFINSSRSEKKNVLFHEMKNQKKRKIIMIIEDYYESLFFPMKPFETMRYLLGKNVLEEKPNIILCFF